MRRQPSTADDMVGTPQGLARSSSGVWWKLMGDASDAGSDASEVDRQLRGIANEEAAVRARIERRHAGAPAVRRKIAVASMGLEVVALLWYGLWRARARRRGSGRAPTTTRPSLLLPALAVPAALATVALAAFGRFRNMLDRSDEQQLERLRAERKAKIGSFRGSHHNLQKLIQKYDPDDAAAAAAAADSNTDGGDSKTTKKLKRTHSRLSFQFHVGEGDE
ncbi:unnamed protein product [Miscanthus lutarioriparius]|uniref:Uncharacterized protein n=1 Tax=Miscanthus lutarioriparius TaxID=422564 RepID=A0A811PIN9_9POAL|nr:unnamed protein product [Miscanthus lutarioriparius]